MDQVLASESRSPLVILTLTVGILFVQVSTAGSQLKMSQIHLLLGVAVLYTIGLRVLTMPLEESSAEEISLEFNTISPFTNSSEADPFMFNDCYLQKNESGIITTVNKTREEVGNDTYIGYEEICAIITRRLSPGALASLAGK